MITHKDFIFTLRSALTPVKIKYKIRTSRERVGRREGEGGRKER